MQKYPQINIRIHDDLLKRIDAWRRREDDLPGRPEAIRRLVERALIAKPRESKWT
jgi:metal-responsive CopG/Arc/MetJ family transcriptional regulator